jgi:hypothetical protein
MKPTHYEVFIRSAKGLHIQEKAFTNSLQSYKNTHKPLFFTYKEVQFQDKKMVYFPKNEQIYAQVQTTVSTDDTQTHYRHSVHRESLPLHLFPSSQQYDIKRWVQRTTFKLTPNLYLNFQKETYDDEPSKTYNIIYFNHNKPQEITQKEYEYINDSVVEK